MGSEGDSGFSDSEMSWDADSNEEEEDTDYLINDSSSQPSTRAKASYTIIDRHQLERIQVRSAKLWVLETLYGELWDLSIGCSKY